MKPTGTGNKVWFNVLDPRVFKSGVRIKTCLDCSDILYKDSDDGSSTNEEDWFTGTVRTSYNDRDEDAWVVHIERDDRTEEGTWQITFPKAGTMWLNVHLAMIYIKEWDD